MRIIAMTLLALISSSLSLEASPTAQASELPRYFYYYLGEPVALEETAGTLAVFDRARGSADPLRQLLEDAAVPQPQVEPHPIGGWFLVRFDAESADAPPGIPSLITRLIGHDVTGRFFFSPVFRGPGGSPIIVPPEILVLFEDGVDEPDVARLLRDVGISGGLRTPWAPILGNAFKVSTLRHSGIDVLEISNRLTEMPEVVFAEPDMIIRGSSGGGAVYPGDRELVTFPSDPEFSDSWGLWNTGQFPGAVDGFDIKAPVAWDVTLGDPDVITVVIDVGVQQNHPDIHQIPGRDFTYQGGDGGPVNKCDNHGTPVAGVISETVFNLMGTVGVAPQTRVASARTFISLSDSNGDCTGTWDTEISWTVEALQWARDIGARVTNNSNSYRDEYNCITLAYKQSSGGLLHFASAGNQPEGVPIVTYPAKLDWVRAVSAMSWDGSLADFSSWGPQIEFTAPGFTILTTDRTGPDGWSQHFDTVFVYGTSFAAPMAAGTAALLFSRNQEQTPFDVLGSMVSTARDLGEPGRDSSYGYGLVNAGSAVKLVADTIFRDGFESGDTSRWIGSE